MKSGSIVIAMKANRSRGEWISTHQLADVCIRSRFARVERTVCVVRARYVHQLKTARGAQRAEQRRCLRRAILCDRRAIKVGGNAFRAAACGAVTQPPAIAPIVMAGQRARDEPGHDD